MEQMLRRTLPLLTTASFAYYYNQNQPKSVFPLRTLFTPRLPAQALCTDEDRKRMKDIHTNVYVWGEGYQVDASQEYSNFTPKKIRNFEGPDKPDIVDVAFGWYHEAYIDKQGRLYVCPKARMSSIKVKEIPDGVRNPITEIKTLPTKSKVRQVSFIRQRMFVLTEDGKLYSFRIIEKAPDRSDPFAA